MSQSEAILENRLIEQLTELGYTFAPVHDGDTLLSNLKYQLERFNKTSFTAKEFDAILNHLAKGNVFEKAKTLRDRPFMFQIVWLKMKIQSYQRGWNILLAILSKTADLLSLLLKDRK